MTERDKRGRWEKYRKGGEMNNREAETGNPQDLVTAFGVLFMASFHHSLL